MPTIDIGIIEKLDYKRDYANWDRFESYKHMIKFYGYQFSTSIM